MNELKMIRLRVIKTCRHLLKDGDLLRILVQLAFGAKAGRKPRDELSFIYLRFLTKPKLEIQTVSH